MIEFKSKKRHPLEFVDDWCGVVNQRTRMFEDFNFHLCDYKIDGTVYTKRTKAFIKAFEAERLFMKIKYDRI